MQASEPIVRRAQELLPTITLWGMTEDDVVSLCRGRLASFKIPRQVHFVDQFPMTGSGKIQKYLLREEARRRGASSGSSIELSDAGSGDHEAARLVAGTV